MGDALFLHAAEVLSDKMQISSSHSHIGPSARNGGLPTPNKVASYLFKYFLHAFCVGIRIHVCVCTFVSLGVCTEGRRQPWVSFLRVPPFS